MRIHLVFLYSPATYMTEVDKDKDNALTPSSHVALLTLTAAASPGR